MSKTKKGKDGKRKRKGEKKGRLKQRERQEMIGKSNGKRKRHGRNWI